MQLKGPFLPSWCSLILPPKLCPLQKLHDSCRDTKGKRFGTPHIDLFYFILAITYSCESWWMYLKELSYTFYEFSIRAHWQFYFKPGGYAYHLSQFGAKES